MQIASLFSLEKGQENDKFLIEFNFGTAHGVVVSTQLKVRRFKSLLGPFCVELFSSCLCRFCLGPLVSS